MAAGDGKLWLIVAGEFVTAWRSNSTGGFDPIEIDPVA